MAIYKNNNGTWYVMIRYQDWTGARKQKCKRGFATRKEAADWELQFKLQKKASLDMTMESFCALYEEDVRPSLKQSTWLTKENIIQKKILPYLGQRKVSEITAKDVMDWHNQMRKLKTKTGKYLSPTYLKTIHGQLSTIFNHAVKYYDLSTNPARKAGALGTEEGKEMLFWTKEEYKLFAEEMMDKPLSYYAFQLLYWCGIRSGELLALTPADFNFKKKTLRINKSYQRLQGKDVITTPKTKNSIRTVVMPQFLCDEMQDCLKLYYSLKPDDRIFPVTKYYLNHEMERGCKACGVKKIRVHDLRHSHVSLLINMGYTALAIGKRVGHSAEKITYRYHCAIILIGHMNKNSNGKSSYRGLGSIDFQAAARSVLIVGRIKEEPETRVVCHTKSSLAPEGKSIAFRLDKDNGFEWIGEYDISADELLNGDGKGQKSRKAKEFLLEILADGGMSQKKILEEAAKRGIKGKTLRNAKSELEVDSIKRGNQWYWVLPE